MISAKQVEKPSFVEFLKEWELNLMCGIDFTASNGDPAKVSSLHYIYADGSFNNDYEQAILGVCSILDCYSETKSYAARGFGAKSYNGGPFELSHSFPLGDSDTVIGCEGLLSAYKRTVTNCTFYGPTFFCPLLTDFYRKI